MPRSYAVRRPRPGRLDPVSDASQHTASGAGPVIIGLAGGIGAGKSSVAAALRDLGCVVIDSDAEAKAALRRPEVRAEIARWWGASVLDAAGEVDRGAVARIVFSDSAQRRRLEALIHPLLKLTRDAVIAEAGERGTPAVVLDAPLLFEAGLDRECDAVIFVDAPRAERLRRVRARGWDDAELARREKSQAPLETKRRSADHVVDNSAGEPDLRARVSEVFSAIMQGRRRRQAPPR